MYRLCNSFYKEKTEARLIQFNLKYPSKNKIFYINDKAVPTADELLRQLNWDELNSGSSYFIHGDLQPDNIIFDRDENIFTLLDWRQDFAGRIDLGDIYYDFAKLWGGLYLNYDQIKVNNFSYIETLDSCRFQFPSHPFMLENQSLLESYVKEKGYSVKKIKLLVGIIYLNMSPLHHAPFDKMLHALGRLMIYDTLKEA